MGGTPHISVIGFDIGGANIKAALVRVEEDFIKDLRTKLEYFPIWKRGKEKLPQTLRDLRSHLAETEALSAVGVTMTAELSDIFYTKKEGVNYILDCVSQVFSDTPIWVLNVEAALMPIKDAKIEYLKVAAANWAATGWMISKVMKIRDCIIVDVGSTTTSIIPIVNGEIAARGKTDLEKLINGELIYTGTLRTNVAAICNTIPLRRRKVMVSSEFFAQSGDVHLILNNISEMEYSVDTPDGRGKSKEEAMARLARVICADIETLSENEIISIAKYIWDKQVELICRGLRHVYRSLKSPSKKIPVIVTGIGRRFLAKKAAEKAGFTQIIDLGELMGEDVAVMSPSVGVALMAASKIKGRVIEWRRLLRLEEA